VSQTGGSVNGSAVAGSHYTISNGSISGNLYSGGNITQTGGSVQNVVAGGNYGVTYAGPNSAIVGGAYSQTGGWTPGNVTVGGNATLSGGASVGGHVQVNGNYTQSGGWVNGGVTHTGTYVGPSGQTHNTGPAVAIDTSSYTTLPFSFTDAATYLTDQSSAWNALATTGTISGSSGQLLLTGLDASLNVFNLTASQLTTGFTFKLNVPAGSTTLINVAGSSVNLGPFGFEYTGADAEHVLFNLAGATSVNMQGIGLLGTLLAPNADVNFVSGNIDGTLIARNLSGYGESHLHLFQGYVPPGTFNEPPSPPGGDTGTAVPLPASALGGMALMGMLATRRQRRST
jgi:choice-of-anchor A domain-containing protein